MENRVEFLLQEIKRLETELALLKEANQRWAKVKFRGRTIVGQFLRAVTRFLTLA